MPLDTPTHWSRKKILFILENLPQFRAGIIPDYRITGYTTAPYVKHSVSARAPFEAAVIMAAEATLRVERAGNDGLLVMAVYVDDLAPHKIARLFRCDEYRIWQRINRALRYTTWDDCLICDYKYWRRMFHR